MMNNILESAFLILMCTTISTSRRFDNYTLVSVRTDTEAKYSFLQHILQDLKVDVWASNRNHADFLVSPISAAVIFQKLNDVEIAFDIITSNIQRYIDKTDNDEAGIGHVSVGAVAGSDVTHSRRVMSWLYGWLNLQQKPQTTQSKPNIVGKYARYREISRWLSHISRLRPDISRLENIGKSYRGRNILLMKIGKQREDGSRKPIIWIDGGMHAREWISIAVAISTINKLLTENDKNKKVLEMIEKFDWYILPVVNPDGYEHTHTKNRFWRKTRSPQSPCFGVDVNRNFDIDYGGTDASKFKCSETYIGKKAFSELETLSMRNALSKYSDRIQAVISLHSYGQLLLLPFAFNDTKPSDYEDLKHLAKICVQAIENVNGRTFTFGTPPGLIYAASGSSTDWAKMKLGIKYVFTFELRPEKATWGSPGFVLPAHEIAPSSEEFFATLVAMTEHINLPFTSV